MGVVANVSCDATDLIPAPAHSSLSAIGFSLGLTIAVPLAEPPRRPVNSSALKPALLSPHELGLVLAALVNGLAIERAFDPAAVPTDLLPRLFTVLQAGLSATAEKMGTDY